MKKTLYKMKLKSEMGVVSIWSCWDCQSLQTIIEEHTNRGFILWQDIEEYKIVVTKEQIAYLDYQPYCKVCQ